MKAVIVAAGMGIRLGSLTRQLPKGLIEFGRKSLIEHSMNAVAAHGLHSMVIVVGFEGSRIRQRIGGAYAGMGVIYAEDPDFATTILRAGQDEAFENLW